MQLSITGHHVDVTDALRNYVNAKFDKIERHYDHITNAHVVLTVEKQVQKAEATLHVTGSEVFADSENEDLYAAIDAMSDKLDRQIIKHKEKTVERHHGR
ncbi:MAG: ribosome-associated translation inhibitor RaiA [Pseudomonadaceae bacterium]|nr:ribosome-associated translation inhibitor RaiA [Pseudomonadaceae bacterium]